MQFPAQQSLRFRGWTEKYDPWEHTTPKRPSVPITAFEIAPNLKVVELTGLAPSLICLPWSQLTRFFGDRASIQDALQVLCKASSLIDCTFESIAEADDESSTPLQPPPDYHVHQKLQSLAFTGMYNMCEVLSHMTMPALTALDLWIPVSDVDDMVDFLTRSEVTLQQLNLHCVYDTFLSILPFMAGLTQLTVAGIRRDGIMFILRSLCSSDTFLPRLQALEITAQNLTNYRGFGGYEEGEEDSSDVDPPQEMEQMNYETLADALWARRTGDCAQGGVSRLESFRMVWIPTVSPYVIDVHRGDSWNNLGFNERETHRELANFGTLDRLLDLVDEGMSVYLGTRHRQWVTRASYKEDESGPY
ncbi:hypothetical protein B0H19DRAFT_293290 [Mycena capillaripes]|nr:hypothetical protein B0H19DRAFT_293290 [Mycena capillaripes]